MTKSKKAIPILLAASLAALPLLGIPAAPAAANSAPAYWDGTSSSGPGVVGACPVEVKREDLTLTVYDLPAPVMSDLSQYTASVEAAYTFYNPTDGDVDVTLAFPFGELPTYVDYSANPPFDDTARYQITADGEEVERTVRYLASSYSGAGGAIPSYRLEHAAFDGKIEDDFFAPDLVCHTHVVDVSLENAAEEEGMLSVMLSYSPNRTRILFDGDARSWGLRDGEYQIVYFMSKSAEITFYSLGEAPTITAKVYPRASVEDRDRTPLAGAVATVSDGEDMTYAELVEAARPEFVEENNYYNIVTDWLTSSGQYSYGASQLWLPQYENQLTRVYVYSLHIPAKTELVNVVTAPLYPDYAPTSCFYRYLLSPAEGWADFGEFHLTVKTPYTLYNCTLPLTEHNADGQLGEHYYEYTRDGLPLGELTFNIRNPGRGGGSSSTVPYVFGVIGLSVLAVDVAIQLIAAIVVIVVYCAGRKQQK